MPRRVIVSRDDMYRRRASAWQKHYELRGVASAMIKTGTSAEQVVSVLKYYYPEPEISIDGYLIEKPPRFTGCSLNIPDSLRVYWYWGFGEWMQFVRLFQALPEVYEDYYFQGRECVLVPMSSKSKQGRAVDKLVKSVDKPVDKSGITTSKKVQISSFGSAP